jgi:hypothetical protein
MAVIENIQGVGDQNTNNSSIMLFCTNKAVIGKNIKFLFLFLLLLLLCTPLGFFNLGLLMSAEVQNGSFVLFSA